MSPPVPAARRSAATGFAARASHWTPALLLVGGMASTLVGERSGASIVLIGLLLLPVALACLIRLALEWFGPSRRLLARPAVVLAACLAYLALGQGLLHRVDARLSDIATRVQQTCDADGRCPRDIAPGGVARFDGLSTPTVDGFQWHVRCRVDEGQFVFSRCIGPDVCRHLAGGIGRPVATLQQPSGTHLPLSPCTDTATVDATNRLPR